MWKCPSLYINRTQLRLQAALANFRFVFGPVFLDLTHPWATQTRAAILARSRLRFFSTR